MANPRFPNICPLGKLTVATIGTTVSLALNCGLLEGTTAGLPGTALRQVLLTADKANTGQVFVLPRGYTAAANPGFIIASIQPGQAISLPPSGSQFGLLPENFVIDSDTAAQSVYGCGFFF